MLDSRPTSAITAGSSFRYAGISRWRCPTGNRIAANIGVGESLAPDNARRSCRRSRSRWLIAARPAHAVDAKKIFNQRCTACHTYGKGVKVGPDLKGVTARRQRPWLLKFIRSSQQVIASGDKTANELFRTYKRQRMPDWTDLSPQDVAAILDWLAADGPEQKPADERDAELASAGGRRAGAGAVRRARAARQRRPRLRRLPHRARPRPAHRRHARAGADRHLPQVPRSRADLVAAPPVHAAAAGARLRPLPGARRGVRDQGLPARRGARRVAVRDLPDHRSQQRGRP